MNDEEGHKLQAEAATSTAQEDGLLAGDAKVGVREPTQAGSAFGLTDSASGQTGAFVVSGVVRPTHFRFEDCFVDLAINRGGNIIRREIPVELSGSWSATLPAIPDSIAARARDAKALSAPLVRKALGEAHLDFPTLDLHPVTNVRLFVNASDGLPIEGATALALTKSGSEEDPWSLDGALSEISKCGRTSANGAVPSPLRLPQVGVLVVAADGFRVHRQPLAGRGHGAELRVVLEPLVEVRGIAPLADASRLVIQHESGLFEGPSGGSVPYISFSRKPTVHARSAEVAPGDEFRVRLAPDAFGYLAARDVVSGELQSVSFTLPDGGPSDRVKLDWAPARESSLRLDLAGASVDGLRMEVSFQNGRTRSTRRYALARCSRESDGLVLCPLGGMFAQGTYRLELFRRELLLSSRDVQIGPGETSITCAQDARQRTATIQIVDASSGQPLEGVEVAAVGVVDRTLVPDHFAGRVDCDRPLELYRGTSNSNGIVQIAYPEIVASVSISAAGTERHAGFPATDIETLLPSVVVTGAYEVPLPPASTLEVTLTTARGEIPTSTYRISLVDPKTLAQGWAAEPVQIVYSKDSMPDAQSIDKASWEIRAGLLEPGKRLRFSGLGIGTFRIVAFPVQPKGAPYIQIAPELAAGGSSLRKRMEIDAVGLHEVLLRESAPFLVRGQLSIAAELLEDRDETALTLTAVPAVNVNGRWLAEPGTSLTPLELDPAGRWEGEFPHPGLWLLHARRPGFQGAAFLHEIAPGASIELDARSTIRLRVLDSEDRPWTPDSIRIRVTPRTAAGESLDLLGGDGLHHLHSSTDGSPELNGLGSSYLLNIELLSSNGPIHRTATETDIDPQGFLTLRVSGLERSDRHTKGQEQGHQPRAGF